MAVSREALFEQVWSEPMTRVGARYHVLRVPRDPVLDAVSVRTRRLRSSQL